MLNYIHKKHPFQALDIFKKHLQSNFLTSIDDDTITIALKACSGDQSQDAKSTGKYGVEAISAFIEMVREGMRLDRVSFTSAISACISWTTIISINEKDAVSLFNEIRLNGVYPNDVTFIGLIRAMSTGKLVEEGKMIHGFCIKTSFVSELNVCNSLITMYAKLDSMHDSRRIFEELNYREIISWNALISGYAQNGLFQAALLTFLSTIMESKPNRGSFT
ncbi:hypothetical protein QYF36_021836 [Acer negundo]|nr:hypothetical protein QYF36_021836 [Acer negundo]